MRPPITDDTTGAFEPLRPALIRLAYRMLGSVADAEDAVQEAFVRWLRSDRSRVREPAAFLRRIVTHLCLDQLKSLRRRREAYIGPWLPDPIIGDEQDDDVTLPLMLALERLSPSERAAFLLHDVFGLAFEEVARTIGREPATCRQLASRARGRVRDARPRFQVEKQQGQELAAAFFNASRSGDMTKLRSLLAADVSLHADGGGKRAAGREPVFGLDPVMKLHEALAAVFRESGSQLIQIGQISGLPGFISREADGELQATALDIVERTVAAIYVIRNPDKLRHLYPSLQSPR